MSSPHTEQTRWFAAEVQPHEPMLRAWLEGRFGVAVDIDDVVQEAFVRVLRARETGAVQSPKAFLFATARNFALDHVRRRHLAPVEPLEHHEALHVLDESQGVAETAARNQELALLTEAIQTLPTRCRQVFTLRTVYGMTQRAIAEKLGISDRTVAAQIAIGLNKCTEFMLRRYEGRRPGR
jgi:RNA polymerase sigma factor (sigma-70 family)